MATLNGDVCFTPNNGHPSDRVAAVDQLLAPPI
jgi:hypothetical protein